MKEALEAYVGLAEERHRETLAALRAEAQANSLVNAALLVTTVLEIAELCAGKRAVPPEVDTAVSELLGHLLSVEPDKSASFDRSLALTIHRSRLDRARQLEAHVPGCELEIVEGTHSLLMEASALVRERALAWMARHGAASVGAEAAAAPGPDLG